MSRTTATRQVSALRSHPYAKTLKRFTTASGTEGAFYSLPALARSIPNVARLPVSLPLCWRLWLNPPSPSGRWLTWGNTACSAGQS